MNAIVLAGGRGSRLQPWTAPKSLMPIRGVTILRRLLHHLRSFDTSGQVILCTGYRASDVEASLRSDPWVGARTSFAGIDASMGKRLQHAYALLPKERVLIVYGDEIADVDINRLLTKHGHNVMTFTAAPQKVPGGTVDDHDGVKIVEDMKVLVNIGFVVVEPECWKHLQDEDGLSGWINRMTGLGSVGYYLHEGKRSTVNTLADLATAEEMWA